MFVGPAKERDFLTIHDINVDFFCLSVNFMELVILMLGNRRHCGRVSNSTLHDVKIVVIAGESATLHCMYNYRPSRTFHF